MNQIIDMILRQLTRRLVNKGVEAGIDQVSRLGRKKEEPEQVEGQPTQKEIREARRARRKIREARRAAREEDR